MKTVDLFAGCGGLSLGFQNAGCNCSGGVIKNALHQNGGNQHKN
jgi:hypothetical protein